MIVVVDGKSPIDEVIGINPEGNKKRKRYDENRQIGKNYQKNKENKNKNIIF